MNRRTRCFAVLGAVAVLLTSGCSGSQDDRPAVGADTSAAPNNFIDQAARACTTAVNDHLAGAVEPAGINVLTAIHGKDEPTDVELERWHDAFDAETSRLEGIRDTLSSVTTDDAEQQADWDAVVAAGDGAIRLASERRDLLRTGDWALISAEFPAAADVGGAETAGVLDRLALTLTDCAAPYDAGRDVLDGQVDFERQASAACLEIWSRRTAADHTADTVTSAQALVTLKQVGEFTDVPDGLEEALGDLVDEWVRTVDDLSGVTATAPGKTSWDEVVAAAEERVTVHSERLAAARTEDLDLLAELYQADWQHPGIPYADAGMDRPVCLGAGG